MARKKRMSSVEIIKPRLNLRMTFGKLYLAWKRLVSPNVTSPCLERTASACRYREALPRARRGPDAAQHRTPEDAAVTARRAAAPASEDHEIHSGGARRDGRPRRPGGGLDPAGGGGLCRGRRQGHPLCRRHRAAKARSRRRAAATGRGPVGGARQHGAG